MVVSEMAVRLPAVRRRFVEDLLGDFCPPFVKILLNICQIFANIYLPNICRTFVEILSNICQRSVKDLSENRCVFCLALVLVLCHFVSPRHEINQYTDDYLFSNSTNTFFSCFVLGDGHAAACCCFAAASVCTYA